MIDLDGTRVIFVGVGASAFISESLFGGKKGWLSQGSIGVAFDTATGELLVYKSGAATEPPFGTVMGIGFGPGLILGSVEGDMDDFLGASWERTGYLGASYTSIETCSGKKGFSIGFGGKGIAVGYTDVTTWTYKWNTR